MKKLIAPLFILLSLTAFSFDVKKSTPEETVTNFLNAINDRDWEKAKFLATPESEELLDMIIGFAEMAPDSSDNYRFVIVHEKTIINNDLAEINVRDENGDEMIYKVKKIEKEWKVDFTIEAILGEDYMKEMDGLMEDMEEEE
ncbi:MAG: DUF4878 domain-containing protein [Fimbriimonadaceae bacterium]|nr:DUF4878 domain-containing protein [Chitinophagales bacterium]